MELYTALVKEFHIAGRNQILGVFIRDVNPEPSRQESLGFSPSMTPPYSSPPGSPLRTPTLIPKVESPGSGRGFTISQSTTANMTTSPAPYDTDRFSREFAAETASPADVPRPPRHQNSSDTTMSDPAIALAIANAASSTPSLTKKRAEFKTRLAKAREGMPPEVPFVVFVHPQECIDLANGILDGLALED